MKIYIRLTFTKFVNKCIVLDGFSVGIKNATEMRSNMQFIEINL